MALVRFKGMPQLPSLENQCLDVALVNCYFKYLFIFNFLEFELFTTYCILLIKMTWLQVLDPCVHVPV